MKHTIFGIGTAFLLILSQMAGYKLDGIAQNGAPSQFDAVQDFASGEADPLSFSEARSPTTATFRIPELHLLATFKGDLPCADCEGIRYHLDL